MTTEKHILGMKEKVEKLREMLGGCEMFHELISTLDATTTIFMRSPFDVGDRVMLAETPEITEKSRWGWMGCKHFLIAGAMATITEREFRDGLFWYGIKFDSDSWIDYEGTKFEREPGDRRLFYFSELWLENNPNAAVAVVDRDDHMKHDSYDFSQW